MKAWFYALIIEVKPYLGNDKWIKIKPNETLMKWKESHIKRFEKENPFAFHLCLVKKSYLNSSLKCHNLFCEYHLGKGLWNLRETISVPSLWDHIYKINISFDKRPWVYHKKRKPKLPKEDRYSWSFSFYVMNLDVIQVCLWILCDDVVVVDEVIYSCGLGMLPFPSYKWNNRHLEHK